MSGFDQERFTFAVNQYDLCIISDALESLTLEREGDLETAILHDARLLLHRVNSAVAERDRQRQRGLTLAA